MSRSGAARASGWVLRWAACVLAATAISVPWAVERAVEQASFEDRLGTLPVEVRLAHNGFTTLDTGLLGEVYWRRTATAGFGAELRSTGPPVAGGTLASYVSPAFARANTRFLDDPSSLAASYGAELRAQVLAGTVRAALSVGLLGGTGLVFVWYRMAGRPRRTRWLVVGGVLVLGTAASFGVAVTAFRSWEGNQPVQAQYPLPGRPDVSFSSPQAREVAEQVQPFIEKNITRIKDRAARYETAATSSLRSELARRAATIAPRDGEVIVLAEADPQGSLVGTRVRSTLYAEVDRLVPDGTVVVRTVAGDLTSNGTVAEKGFVTDEVSVDEDVPVVAAKGDHDTEETVDQLTEAGAVVPDTEVVEVGGLRVASARDPAFKALFGGLVINESGNTEQDVGAALREVVDADRTDRGDGTGAYDVVVHQPRAVEGYLGLDLAEVTAAAGSFTRPVDDGIPGLPPGIVTYGHLHDPAGPWVVWNTDGDQVTWTVITQLGTAGGVEENPTVNRFSTPFSAPLKPLSVQLQYVNATTGLQTGLVPVTIDTKGLVTVGDRVDVGLPGGLPGQDPADLVVPGAGPAG